MRKSLTLSHKTEPLSHSMEIWSKLQSQTKHVILKQKLFYIFLFIKFGLPFGYHSMHIISERTYPKLINPEIYCPEPFSFIHAKANEHGWRQILAFFLFLFKEADHLAEVRLNRARHSRRLF